MGTEAKNVFLKEEKLVDNISDNRKNKRELNIDLMKAMLVFGMIFSHVFDFFFVNNVFALYFNLISFSGFMFVFGYNSYNAYIKKESSNKKILKNMFKLIVAFYISGFAYEFFINQDYEIEKYIKILCFLKLPGYTEFLATFAVLNVFILVFRSKLKKISQNNNYIVIGIIISAFFSIIPTVKENIPWANLFIKTQSVSFPLLPYLNLFFIGIYIAKNKPKFNIVICIIACFMWNIHLIMFLKHLETRFPISLTYIIGSYLYLYLYYYISNYICMKLKSSKIQTFITVVRKKYFSIFID